MQNNLRSSPVAVALLHPVNLGMLALAVAAGLCSAWWLFPAGLIVWAVMVWQVARHPALRMSHRLGSRTPLAPRFQRHFDRIQRIQISFYNNTASANPRIRRAIQPVQNQVDELTEQVYRLCLRTSALENYRQVSASSFNDLQTDQADLQRKLSESDDPFLQQQYRNSLLDLEIQIERQKKVINRLDRVEAQLTSLQTALEGMLAEVLRLQSLGPDQVVKYRENLLQTLAREKSELQDLELAEQRDMEELGVRSPR